MQNVINTLKIFTFIQKIWSKNRLISYNALSILYRHNCKRIVDTTCTWMRFNRCTPPKINTWNWLLPFGAAPVVIKPQLPDHSVTLENEKNLEIILAMADRALQDGDTSTAETILTVALNFAEENHMEQAVCRIYDVLINISYSRGDFQSAELLIVRILERLLQSGMHEQDDTIITFKLKLARLYGNLGHNDLADIGFRECADAQREKLEIGPLTDKTGLLYIDVLFWYGMFLLSRGSYQNAYENISRAYTFSNKIHGVTAAQEFVILTILSEISAALGDYDSALLTMTKVIVIGKNIGHPELPFSYVLLGTFYLKKQAYDKARKWCKEGELLGAKQMNARAQEHSKHCLNEIDKAIRDNKNPTKK